MEFKTKEEYERRIKHIIITDDEIRLRVAEAGKYIDSLYQGRPLVLISVLKGSFVFLADLARAVTVPCEICFMAAKSYYESTSSSGEVIIKMDLDRDISGCDVVIVEDIVDSGRTLSDLIRIIGFRGPRSLHVVTLLDKPERRLTDIEASMSLFKIPDVFVIGYGLDYGEYYRNLPYIAEYGE